ALSGAAVEVVSNDVVSARIPGKIDTMGGLSDACTGQLFDCWRVCGVAGESRFAAGRTGSVWRELNRNGDAMSGRDRCRQVQPEQGKLRTGRPVRRNGYRSVRGRERGLQCRTRSHRDVAEIQGCGADAQLGAGGDGDFADSHDMHREQGVPGSTHELKLAFAISLGSRGENNGQLDARPWRDVLWQRESAECEPAPLR